VRRQKAKKEGMVGRGGDTRKTLKKKKEKTIWTKKGGKGIPEGCVSGGRGSGENEKKIKGGARGTFAK